ncbi:hypothetical protein GCM10020258_31860 [Sphingomonas yabuuchiae]
MRDRGQDALGLVLDSELDEAEIRRDADRAIEGHAVEPVLVDIAQEIGGGDRRMGAVEVDHHGAEAGLHRDADHDGLGGLGGGGGGRGRGGGLGGKQCEGQERDHRGLRVRNWRQVSGDLGRGVSLGLRLRSA